MKRFNPVLFTCCLLASAHAADLAAVVSRPVSRAIELPGEMLPFLSVALHAKVPGYVERVTVDRGSIVKQGDLLLELNAPEIAARIAEAESKAQAAQSDRAEAEARRAAAQSTYERLKKASETPALSPATSSFRLKNRSRLRTPW